MRALLCKILFIFFILIFTSEPTISRASVTTDTLSNISAFYTNSTFSLLDETVSKFTSVKKFYAPLYDDTKSTLAGIYDGAFYASDRILNSVVALGKGVMSATDYQIENTGDRLASAGIAIGNLAESLSKKTSDTIASTNASVNRAVKKVSVNISDVKTNVSKVAESVSTENISDPVQNIASAKSATKFIMPDVSKLMTSTYRVYRNIGEGVIDSSVYVLNRTGESLGDVLYKSVDVVDVISKNIDEATVALGDVGLKGVSNVLVLGNTVGNSILSPSEKIITKTGDLVVDVVAGTSDVMTNAGAKINSSVSHSVSNIAGIGSIWNSIIDKISNPLVPLFTSDVVNQNIPTAKVEPTSNQISNTNVLPVTPTQNIINRNIIEGPTYYTIDNSSAVNQLRQEMLALNSNSVESLKSLIALQAYRSSESIYRTIEHTSGGSSSSSNSGGATGDIDADTLSIGSLNGILEANNGDVSASTTLSVSYGGTGLSTAPAYGQLLMGNSNGFYDLVATSSLGISAGADLSSYITFANFAATTTDVLAEGSSNLYFTNNRVAGIIAGTTTDALTEGAINKYYSTSLFATDLSGTTTDSLVEGVTNKYYSNSLVGSYISGSSTIPHIGGSAYGDILSWTGSGWDVVATSTLGITGGVTSINLSAPAGLTVSGGPITSSGTLALSLTSGYTIPLSASTTEWSTSYANRITSASSPLSITNNIISLSTAGDWAGTFDGQEGSYYLNANNLTNFGSPFYSYFSATTTDALTEGATNKYYSSTLFSNDLTATSSLSNILTLGGLNSFGTSGATTTSAGNIDVAGNINFTGALLQNGSPFAGSQWSTSGSDISYTTGNVGIGTAASSDKLSVLGNSVFDGDVTVSSITSGSLLFAGAAGLISENNASLFWEPDNYRLGVGSAGFAAYLGDSAGFGVGSGYMSLDLQSAAGSGAGTIIADSTGGDPTLYFNNANTDSAIEFYNNDAQRIIARMSAGAFSIYSPSFALTNFNASVSDTGLVTFDAAGDAPSFNFSDNVSFSGNVGIGTTTPAAKFAITGAGTGTGKAFVTANSSNVEKFTILDNGNVGIGVSNPTRLFEVAGSSIDVGGNLILAGSNPLITSGAGSLLLGGYGLAARSPGLALGSATGIAWSDTTVAYNAITTDIGLSRISVGTLGVGNSTVGDYSGTLVAGSIGIGTSTPGYALTVAGDISLTGALRANGDAGTTGMVLLSQSSSAPTWVATSTLGIGGSSPWTISSSNIYYNTGNVAVGQATVGATYKLEINGKASTTQLYIPNTTSATVGGIFFGANRMIHNYGTQNFFAGEGAGNITTTGTQNTSIGASSMSALTSLATRNTALGYYSANGITSGQYNTFVGSFAGYQLTTAAYNTGIGYGALSGIVINGDYNIGLGYYAGDNITSGDRNIIIGHLADAPSATGNYQLNIGNIIYGTNVDGTGSTVSTGNIGISTTTPGSLFSIGTTNGINFSTATSTFSSTGGINLTAGCFSVAGVCIGSGGSTPWTTIGSDVYYSTGNVGIGTTTPWGQLSVSPNGITGPAFVVGSTTATNFIVTNGGNIGVGTNSPWSIFSVNTNGNSMTVGDDSSNYLATSFVSPGSGVSTSYVNDGGSGNRTGSITVTTSAGLTYTAGVGTTLVNGTTATNENYFFGVSASGHYIQFYFNDEYKVINEAKFYQSGTFSHGVWQWQASNDGSAWTDIGSTFTLGGYATQTMTELSSNTGGYKYYRIYGQSGTVSGAPWIYEFEFKIGNPVSGYSALQTYVAGATGGSIVLQQDSGNVGIGTSAPVSTLDVYGNLSIGSYAGNAIAPTNGLIVSGKLGVGTSTPWAALAVNPVAGDTNQFVVGSSTATSFIINSAGNVGVGTTTPWKKFSVSGGVSLSGLTGSTGAGSLCLSANNEVVYNSGSDSCLPSLRSMKQDITELDFVAMDKIMALDSVSFIYNNDLSSTTRYGFIAEDTALVDSHFGTYDATGKISGVDDRSIISVLVMAFKELKASLDSVLSWFIGGKFNIQGEVCVDEVCISKEQFKQMLINTNSTTQYYSTSDTTPGSSGNTSSTTDLTSTTEPPVNTESNASTTESVAVEPVPPITTPTTEEVVVENTPEPEVVSPEPEIAPESTPAPTPEPEPSLAPETTTP